MNFSQNLIGSSECELPGNIPFAMASLKEVKTRISSVNSTRKITSAMKMVASSKLHHAQQAIEQMRPYEHKLSEMMASFMGALEEGVVSPYAHVAEVERVAFVVMSSNSSLCGGFNSNVLRQLRRRVEECRVAGIEVVEIVAFGRKATEAVRKMGFAIEHDHAELLDHPRYDAVAQVAEHLMERFVRRELDRVELIYHHFKSAGTQILTTETFLPVDLTSGGAQAGIAPDFIVEPSVEILVERLIPRALHLRLFAAVLDSLASEHAARVIAMQVATDNADDLLRELTLQYNKTRQQAITAELLDIVGGSLQ